MLLFYLLSHNTTNSRQSHQLPTFNPLPPFSKFMLSNGEVQSDYTV